MQQPDVFFPDYIYLLVIFNSVEKINLNSLHEYLSLVFIESRVFTTFFSIAQVTFSAFFMGFLISRLVISCIVIKNLHELSSLLYLQLLLLR
jgi:hypothetical protein